jgi:acyl-CoA thioester hydrolase
VTATLVQCKRASMVFDQAVCRGDETLLTAQVKIAALDAATFKPRGMDDALHAALKPHVIQIAAY